MGKSVRYSARRHTGAGCGRPDSGAGAGGHACPLSGSGPDPQGGHPHRQQSGGGRRRHLSGLYAEHPPGCRHAGDGALHSPGGQRRPSAASIRWPVSQWASRGSSSLTFAALKAAGAVAVSDDGRPVKNAALMQRAIALGYSLRMPVISHCEDLDTLAEALCTRAKFLSGWVFPAWTAAPRTPSPPGKSPLPDSERAAVHIAHVSTKGSAEIIRDARRRGHPCDG